MKRISLLLIAAFGMLLSMSANAQRSGIGFHLTTNEYIGDINNNSYSLYKFKNFKAGGAISLQQYLNSSFNLVEWGGYNRLQYFQPNQYYVAGLSNGVDVEFFNFNAMLKYKFNNGYLFSENAAIAPFLIGGVGVTHIRSKIYSGPQAVGEVKLGGQTKPSLIGGAGLVFPFQRSCRN